MTCSANSTVILGDFVVGSLLDAMIPAAVVNSGLKRDRFILVVLYMPMMLNFETQVYVY